MTKVNAFTHKGSCQYIPGREYRHYTFKVPQMPAQVYENLLNLGFRRSSYYFYRNFCNECKACIPVKVDVKHFKPSKNQRRVLKKNKDVTITKSKVAFHPQDFELYRLYCQSRHQSDEKENNYKHFLIDSAVPTAIMRYYVDQCLMGIGWIDVLPNSLSSVYFAFDPQYSRRSPGVFSAMKEIQLCQQMGKKWLQLGFWVQDCPKMAYKNQYHPYYMLVNGKWIKPAE